MHKVMVFIDYENFNIALNYFSHDRLGLQTSLRLDYLEFPQRLVEILPGSGNRLVKTFLFAPKPDDFLIQERRRKNTYEWLNFMKNKPYFTVAEGRHIARPTAGKPMDIKDKYSYYVEEKGTDVLMATNILSKAFQNAFDTAVIVSNDSDYIPILDVMNTIGKTSVCVGLASQYMERLRPHTDDVILLDEEFFKKCTRPDSVTIPPVEFGAQTLEVARE